VSALFCLVVAGCRDPKAIEKSRQEGATAGKADGRIAGNAAGYKAAYQPAKDGAYDTKLAEMYNSNVFSRKRSYIVIVLGSSFLFGFGLQYLALYLLRSKELLTDIDRIILPKGKTQVNLTELLDPHRPADLLPLEQPDGPSSDSTRD
jgi:hypothetical protein